MRDGYVKVAALTPQIRVADCAWNAQALSEGIAAAWEGGAQIIVCPELCVTGYTCQDLFLQKRLLDAASEAMQQVIESSRGMKALIFAGFPAEVEGKCYNAAAVFTDGQLLGVVPKRYLPNYNEFYEMRHFAPGEEAVRTVRCLGRETAFGMCQLFTAEDNPDLTVAAELCEDLWTADPPSRRHAQAGATIIVNLSASNDLIGKRAYRRSLVASTSARLQAGYIYASAGEGESTQDLVFSGHDLIAESGTILAEKCDETPGVLFGELDVQKLSAERRRQTSYEMMASSERERYVRHTFRPDPAQVQLTRVYARHPFVPDDLKDRQQRCEEILSIQARGLMKRMQHTGCRRLVIGLSGGLDSTLALLVMVRACDRLSISHDQIMTVTMPGFGTTGRTYDNACRMARTLGTDLKEIPISDAVRIHFRDIGHDEQVQDVVYENCQARERTQILMDLANQAGALVVGTGDMSELALGWATYNGDHMSMYAVNSGVPKTLVRHLVRYYADCCADSELSGVLLDVLDTPVSPELLPPQNGEIAQVTEDLVGPYELHDFFLYYLLRFGFPPRKIYRIACRAFEDSYSREEILKWLRTFVRRFFAQQFKRSCIPDGPKVGSVALSPRGDLRMPSDACVTVWMAELDELEARNS